MQQSHTIQVLGRGAGVDIAIDDTVPFEFAERSLLEYLDVCRGLYSSGTVSVNVGRRILAPEQLASIKAILDRETGLTVTRYWCAPEVLEDALCPAPLPAPSPGPVPWPVPGPVPGPVPVVEEALPYPPGIAGFSPPEGLHNGPNGPNGPDEAQNEAPNEAQNAGQNAGQDSGRPDSRPGPGSPLHDAPAQLPANHLPANAESRQLPLAFHGLEQIGLDPTGPDPAAIHPPGTAPDSMPTLPATEAMKAMAAMEATEGMEAMDATEGKEGMEGTEPTETIEVSNSPQGPAITDLEPEGPVGLPLPPVRCPGANSSPTSRNQALLIKATCRSGEVVHYSGDVVVFGDVNPGAQIIAGGDVVVLGALRGMVQAGAYGDPNATIFALNLESRRLQIGSHVGEAPARLKTARSAARPVTPRIAYLRRRSIFVAPFDRRRQNCDDYQGGILYEG